MTLLREGGPESPVSMRRVLALLMCIFSFVGLVFAIVAHAEWQVCLVVVAVPIVAMLALMFFTTWSDVAYVVSAAKGITTVIPGPRETHDRRSEQ